MNGRSSNSPLEYEEILIPEHLTGVNQTNTDPRTAQNTPPLFQEECGPPSCGSDRRSSRSNDGIHHTGHANGNDDYRVDRIWDSSTDHTTLDA